MSELINLCIISNAKCRLPFNLTWMSGAAFISTRLWPFFSNLLFLLRTLGQHGGVHMHDPQGHARRSLLPSRACPASGPLLIGPAGELWLRWECTLSPPHPPPAVYINWCIFLQKTHIDVLLSFHDCSQSLESSLVNLKQAKKKIQKHWKRTLIELYKMALRLFQTGFYYPTRLWNRNKSQTDSFGVFSFFLPPMYSMIAPRCWNVTSPSSCKWSRWSVPNERWPPSPSASHGVCWRSELCFPHFWVLDELMVGWWIGSGAGCQHISRPPAWMQADTCSRHSPQAHPHPHRGPWPLQPPPLLSPSLILEMKSRCGLQVSVWGEEGEAQGGLLTMRALTKGATRSRWSVT